MEPNYNDIPNAKPKRGRPRIERPVPEEVAPDANFAQTIEEQMRMVAKARRLWDASIDAGDANSSKHQSAYNQSLKSLIMLQEEAERRSVFARNHILATESAEAMMKLAGRVVERFESLASECGEACNPNDPIKAISVLSKWAKEARAEMVKLSGAK